MSWGATFQKKYSTHFQLTTKNFQKKFSKNPHYHPLFSNLQTSITTLTPSLFIIHQQDFEETPIIWTKKANPAKLIKEFLEYRDGDDDE